MKLYILTDKKNSEWLTYLMEEFKRIQGAEFDIIVVNTAVEDQKILYHSKSPVEEKCIFDSNMVPPDGSVIWMDGFFLHKGTYTDNANFDTNYDLFWNAFVNLSRLEEWICENRKKNINSHSGNHSRIDKNTFKIPVVNILFDQLEKLIRSSFPEFSFSKKTDANIELSHDVDYITKTFQLRLKQTAFNGFNTMKSLSKPESFISELYGTSKFLFSNPSYWCFDYWEFFEKSINKRSVFYVYVNTGYKNLKSWLIDPSYSITENADLKNKLLYLKSEGFEIGLHGSFDSALSYDLLKKEKNVLEDLLGFEIAKTRQHWLHYREDTTPYIHDNLFKTDSTIGWNDMAGFRSGCASQYRPYDHINKRPFGYFIIPQIIMDSNIFDYGRLDQASKINELKEIINSLKYCRNVSVSISWHQRVCSSDYNWHKLYEEIVCDL